MKKGFRIISLMTALLPALFALSFTACSRLVYEDEGICVVTYNLRFVYDMNLKWADAFPSEVHSVHLYAFDRDGLYVKDFTAGGEEVDREDYRMRLELEPGKYTLVAWCGLENVGETVSSFTVPVPVVGRTRLEELTCALNTKPEDPAGSCSDERLRFLYHGMLEVDLPEVYNGSFDYTMYLTKDTNHIRIILHQLSGEDMNPEEYSFTIEDANTLLGHDNSMRSPEPVRYRPWAVFAEEAGMAPGEGESGDLIYSKGVVADLSTSRLMADHQNDMMLTITGSEGNQIARVPLLQYALMSREYYEMAYGHTMPDQEFLDRQDEYVFTFFLDASQRWSEMHINILSWRVVVHNYGADSGDRS